MIIHRPGDSRGQADLGWLKSWHSFSFADYYDPQFMVYSVLRVINEDFVAPSKGFPTHGHREMEIVTYMVEGDLEHKDTLGNAEHLRAGEVQRMSAGTGIHHSEFNHSQSTQLHLLQIWILPQVQGLQPSYEQKSFVGELGTGKLTLLVSPEGHNGSLKIHQDINLYALKSTEPVALNKPLSEARRYYLQVIRGAMLANGSQLSPGDGLALERETQLEITATKGCEFLLFDLP